MSGPFVAGQLFDTKGGLELWGIPPTCYPPSPLAAEYTPFMRKRSGVDDPAGIVAVTRVRDRIETARYELHVRDGGRHRMPQI